MKDSLATIILPHIIVGFVVFGLMILTAFWGLAYAWWRLRARLVKGPLLYGDGPLQLLDSSQ
jgi:hypothetical protein